MLNVPTTTVVLAFPLCAFVLSAAIGQTLRHCPLASNEDYTNDFSFSASSVDGAQGDVVAVEVSLTIDRLRDGLLGFGFALAYDERLAELVTGEPAYSDDFLRVAYMPNFVEIRGEPGGMGTRSGRWGLLLMGNFRRGADDVFARRLGESVPVCTLLFRLTGDSGSSFDLRFPDEEFTNVPGGCVRNEVSHYIGRTASIINYSTLHRPGVVRILEGEPTQPEPPPVPPEAKVYAEPPSEETADIRFELSGAVVTPGATEVPVEFHITSNYEFIGYILSGRFPAEYLELARIEVHRLAAAQQLDNRRGEFGVIAANARRRVGAEGERVRAATLYFNVKEAARDVREIPITLAPVPVGYTNRIMIRGILEESPIDLEVAPLVVGHGIIRVQERPTRPGDVNLDYELNLSDPVALLGALFRGEGKVACPQAADFNEDGRADLSDAVLMVNHLFLGGPAPPAREVRCGLGSG
jgi:hypothetical protein